MGIDPTVWGPSMWSIIHLVCLQAPKEIDANVRNSYYMFFTMMPYILPCDKCREHWLTHIHTYPLDDALSTRDDLFRWSINMHNLVNKSLGKPEVSYEVALEHWTDVSKNKKPITRCIKGTGDTFSVFSLDLKKDGVYKKLMYVLAILLAILVIVYFYMKR